ncbi:hypothetical protein CmeUKMEL1_05810 [Cryptosporidium meleagridis]|uniref:Uncharacterized protein n=1 Tax=Cryptosporidium meleagridis TaxID=93969 RepID=A0A2P4YZC0_9CRYT|nr:hypothetical protein CmeUKMEL1_05810 [Cryptosporidium meleagridis]
MEYFDDDIISNMNRMEINKRQNIFDDLLGGDDEIEQLNEEEDIFLVDDKRTSNSELLFNKSYNKERNPFEDENREDEVIFGIEIKGEDRIGDEVDIVRSDQKKMSNASAMVGGIDFHEFNNNLIRSEFNDDFDMDSEFESNEDIFSLSKLNRNTKSGEDGKDEGERRMGLVQDEKDILLQTEAYSKEEIDPEQVIETKKNSISEELFRIQEEKQFNEGNFNIENETLGDEELQFENPPPNNYGNASPYIQKNKNLNELSCNKKNGLVPPEKSERKKSDTNVSVHNLLCESKEETNSTFDKNNSETCVGSNKIRMNDNLQSSLEDINWNLVSKIIENFEKQTGNSASNQKLFKSIIFKLANNNGNN